MIRWIVENASLMLLALIISVAVWVVAEWEKDPIVEGEFEQPIPVRVTNQPSDIHLVDGWQDQVRVRLRAPQSVWDQLSPENFEARLNLSPPAQGPLKPGSWGVSAQVSVVNLESVSILEVIPEYIDIELEAIQERLVSVQAQVLGEPDRGYRASEAIVVPDTVKVGGPASQVDQVSQVVTTISVRGTRRTVEDKAASLTAVDAEGKSVNGVWLEPERAQVSVPVTQLPNVKEVSVAPNYLGQPAEDYRIVNVSVAPPFVRVVGPVSILEDLPGFLTTVPISIEGRTQDMVGSFPLDLPPGISTVDLGEEVVEIRIDIEPFIDSVTITRTVTFQGLRPGLEAVASPRVVELILSGPRPRLSTLSPEEVSVILDLSDLRLGDQDQLEPKVELPGEIVVDSIIPSVIQVQIVPQPTPTPTPTPEPLE